MEFFKRRHGAAVFTAVSAAIYAAFLTLDILHRSSIAVKYAGIILCCACALWLWGSGRAKPAVPCALALTLAADTFLLVLNRCYALGVGLFCAVHFIYAAVLAQGQALRRALAVRAGVTAAVWLALAAGGLWQPVTVLSAVSGVWLCANTLRALRVCRGQQRLLAAGLALFTACDLCVALYNAEWLGAALTGTAARAVQLGMWLFYLPAQVLIVLSIWPCAARKESKK